MENYTEVINFWFNEISPAQWWQKDKEFDQEICRRFLALHERAIQCELYLWRETALGALAEIIILDQFSRNLYRLDQRSFLWDPLALALAQTAIKQGLDKELSGAKKAFMYMPFMHSESRRIHEIAVTLFNQPDIQDNLSYELQHKAIIDRFGRYPHRNQVLGRQSSEEEEAFLKTAGSSF